MAWNKTVLLNYKWARQICSNLQKEYFKANTKENLVHEKC